MEFSYFEELTLEDWLESTISPRSTILNLNPWGARDEEIATYFAINMSLTTGSAFVLGVGRSRLAYQIGMLATAAPGTIAGGGLLILAMEGTRAQQKSMTEDKAGVRGTGSFGAAPSLHLVGGEPWWESVSWKFWE